MTIPTKKKKKALRILHACDLRPGWDWSDVFKRPDLPIQMELGSGKGGFLKQAAEYHAEVNWLGIDYATKFLNLAAKRLRHFAEEGRVQLYHGNFEALLAEVPPESLSAVRVYFPDPWHKARHAKRRMLSGDTMHWLHRSLKPGGSLYVRTDVAPFFDEMKEEVAALHPVFRLEDEQHYRDVPTETWFPTNYESRFLAEGFTCHAATFRKAT